VTPPLIKVLPGNGGAHVAHFFWPSGVDFYSGSDPPFFAIFPSIFLQKGGWTSRRYNSVFVVLCSLQVRPWEIGQLYFIFVFSESAAPNLPRLRKNAPFWVEVDALVSGGAKDPLTQFHAPTSCSCPFDCFVAVGTLPTPSALSRKSSALSIWSVFFEGSGGGLLFGHGTNSERGLFIRGGVMQWFILDCVTCNVYTSTYCLTTTWVLEKCSPLDTGGKHVTPKH